MQSVLTIGILICCTCQLQSSSLCLFGFFCLQVSSVSNFCPDIRGRLWSLFQAHLFSRAVGREEHCKQISLACVGSARSVSATLGLPPLMACVLSQSTLLRLQVALPELSEAGPGLRALPRSKPLRFRFSGTPQRHRLGWVCILCPSQVQAAQVIRCLVSTVTPRSGVHLIPSLIPAAQFSGCTMGAPSQVCRVSLLGS